MQSRREAPPAWRTPDLLEDGGVPTGAWRSVALPPRPELMVLGELALAAVEGRSDVGLDEVALAFVDRLARTASDRPLERRPPGARVAREALWTPGPDRRQPGGDRALEGL